MATRDKAPEATVRELPPHNATLHLVGLAPLMMHNRRLADPLDPATRRLAELTGKRSKTISDHEAIARVEFEGSLYIDDELGPYMKGEAAHKCLVEGARLTRNGKEVERAVVVVATMLPIDYPGPRDTEGLWREGFYSREATGIAGRAVIRTRPIWPDWELTVPLMVDRTRIDFDVLAACARDAGAYVGIGERRPHCGRFTAEMRELVQ